MKHIEVYSEDAVCWCGEKVIAVTGQGGGVYFCPKRLSQSDETVDILYGVWDNWGKRFLLADSGRTFKTDNYSIAMMAKTKLENDGAVGLEIRQMSEDWLTSEKLIVKEERK